MKRLYIGAVVLALLAGPARAGDRSCYVLWEAQCFEIHDAETRDITHHILMTDGPLQLQAQADTCSSEQMLLKDGKRQSLRAAFRKRMGNIDGCEPLDELKSRTSQQAEPLVERFQSLREPNKNREVHILEPPDTGT